MSSVDRGWKSVHWECGLKTCQNKLFLRSMPQSHIGVRFNQTWYCSVDCFVKAARSRFAALSEVPTMDVPHSPRMPIGSVMLAKGYLTREELQFALAQSRRNGEELETTLIRLSAVDEWQLASARAMQWGYPVLGRDRVSHAVTADVPVSLMRTFSAAPLHYSTSAQRLVVGFVYRVEHSLLHALEHATGCRAEPCFITPTAFNYQMERMQCDETYREVVLQDSWTPEEMAKTVGRFALEVTAREASLSHCQGYLWMRLAGKRRTIDVLFRGRTARKVQYCDTLPTSVEGMRAIG